MSDPERLLGGVRSVLHDARVRVTLQLLTSGRAGRGVVPLEDISRDQMCIRLLMARTQTYTVSKDTTRVSRT